MSTAINSSSVPAPSSNTPRKTRVARSRRELKALGLDAKIKYIYKVKAEAPMDLVWAFHTITEYGYSYKPRPSNDGTIIFSTKVDIEDLREMWDAEKKDLHVMIESLNYVDDYTGDRYFTKYWDANYDDDVEYYCSDSEDYEDDYEEEPRCKFCECDPNEEDHLEDCESLQYNNKKHEEDEEEEPCCKYCQSNPSEEGHDEDCELLQTNKRIECNKKLYG